MGKLSNGPSLPHPGSWLRVALVASSAHLGHLDLWGQSVQGGKMAGMGFRLQGFVEEKYPSYSQVVGLYPPPSHSRAHPIPFRHSSTPLPE